MSYLFRKSSWQDLQAAAGDLKAGFRLARLLGLAAATSLGVSDRSFSLCSLNLACSVQISLLALVVTLGSLSVPATKPAQGSLAIWSITSAFSIAALAS